MQITRMQNRQINRCAENHNAQQQNKKQNQEFFHKHPSVNLGNTNYITFDKKIKQN
jgi:hypothetical protein